MSEQQLAKLSCPMEFRKESLFVPSYHEKYPFIYRAIIFMSLTYLFRLFDCFLFLFLINLINSVTPPSLFILLFITSGVHLKVISPLRLFHSSHK